MDYLAQGWNSQSPYTTPSMTSQITHRTTTWESSCRDGNGLGTHHTMHSIRPKPSLAVVERPTTIHPAVDGSQSVRWPVSRPFLLTSNSQAGTCASKLAMPYRQNSQRLSTARSLGLFARPMKKNCWSGKSGNENSLRLGSACEGPRELRGLGACQHDFVFWRVRALELIARRPGWFGRSDIRHLVSSFHTFCYLMDVPATADSRDLYRISSTNL